MNPLRRNDAFASYTETIITSLLVSLIVFMAVVSQPEAAVLQPNKVPQDNVTTDVESFNFHVHCPLRSKKDGGFVELMNHLQISDNATISKIEAELSRIDTYAVFERVFTVDPSNRSSEMLMSYCGWAKLLNESDCSNAQFVCTIPGPMFRVAARTEIAVVWVNQIEGADLDWSSDEDNCYEESNNNSYCWQMGKQEARERCTFETPTALGPAPTKLVRISPRTAPISPHVHGLHIRPSFDGNPYSWFNNAGDKGIGYFSASTNDYFTLFNRSLTFWPGLLSPSQQAAIKVNRYLNAQPPGFCFYHDHAMRTTLFNNMKGSAGFYLIFDQAVEAALPQLAEETIVIFHYHNEGDVRDYASQDPEGVSDEMYVSPIGDTMFVSNKEDLYRNMTYRFRFINGHFDDFYNNVSFAVFYRMVKDLNGFARYEQLQPPLHSPNFTQNMFKIPFSAISADSALFHRPINGLDHFSLAGAERFEILIKFDSIPSVVSKVYIVGTDANADMDFVVKFAYNLSSEAVGNKYPNPSQYSSFDVPFTDLSAVGNISKLRMRALFSRPIEVVFTINMHRHFEGAACEDPQIGTLEDWLIINTASESHPIHLHIVNFQVVEELALKTTPDGCSLYELDYFRESNISNFQIADDAELCYYLNNLTSEILAPLWPAFDSYLLENETKPTDIGPVSGKNVLEKLATASNKSRYSVQGCPLNAVYKYICSNSSGNIFPWYRRWKDTAEIKAFTVSRLRMRWAEMNYDPSVSAYPFFSHGEDEMLEFPGSTYHCHILPHEENMMMRPIMLQPSDAYLALRAAAPKDLGKCTAGSWLQSQKCINEALGC